MDSDSPDIMIVVVPIVIGIVTMGVHVVLHLVHRSTANRSALVYTLGMGIGVVSVGIVDGASLGDAIKIGSIAAVPLGMGVFFGFKIFYHDTK